MGSSFFIVIKGIKITYNYNPLLEITLLDYLKIKLPYINQLQINNFQLKILYLTEVLQ